MPETAITSTSGPHEAAIAAALGARSIVLVGMMGAGKSTIGRRLAARLRLPFLDADAEIEAAAGMSIPDIFETHGEPHFRDGEARVIARLLESGPSVLATGGGAFMREETRNRIRARAVSMWLKADADTILKRVRRRADISSSESGRDGEARPRASRFLAQLTCCSFVGSCRTTPDRGKHPNRIYNSRRRMPIVRKKSTSIE